MPTDQEIKKSSRWLKKVLKVFLWLIAGVVVLFVVVVFCIRLESVQNFLIKKATTFVSDKTKSKVTIGHIYISFPKEIVVENIFVEDRLHDTLLSAGLIGINIEMLGLLKNKLNIEMVRIHDLRSHIYRGPADTLFNYSFIANAFASADTSEQIKDTSAKGMQISLDKIELQRIRINYDDSLGGMLLASQTGTLNVSINELNIQENKFKIDDVNLADSKITILNLITADKKTDTVARSLPDIQLNKLNIENCGFKMQNESGKNKTILSIGKIELVNKSLSLSHSTAEIEKLNVENSFCLLSSEKIKETKNKNTTTEISQPWKVSADELHFSDIRFVSDYTNVKKQLSGFDANHIDVKDFNAEIKKFIFQPEKTSAEIASVSLSEHSGINIKEFKTHFTFDPHQIVFGNLDLIINNSNFGDHVSIQYSSLEKISDSPGDLGLNINLKNAVINTSDILLFQPALKTQPLFAGNSKSIHITTQIKGSVKDLVIPELMVATGDRTRLRASLAIKGLPDANHAFYRIQIPLLATGKKDLAAILPGQIPSHYIPDDIFLSGNFTGRLNAFNSIINAKTSLGNLDAKIEMPNGDQNYSAVLEATDINAGKLLKDSMFGKVSFHTELKGSSFNIENAVAELNTNIKSAEINKYTYENLNINTKIDHQLVETTVQLNDSNLAFNLDGKVNLKKNNESYQVTFDLKGADLKNLNFSNDDVRLAAKISADLKGNSMSSVNGTAGITNLIVIKNNKNYTVDSVLFASVNEPGKSSFNISSSIIAAKFEGSIVPLEVAQVISNQFNRYFDTGDTVKDLKPQNFSFEVVIKNDPLLKEVLLPGLSEFENMKIAGSLSSETNKLILSAEIPRLNYSGINIQNFKFDMNTEDKKLNYLMTLGEISNSSVKIINTSLGGEIKDDVADINLSMKDSLLKNKLFLGAKLTSLREGDFHVAIVPQGLVLNDSAWSVPQDNFIRFGRDGLLFNHFELSNASQYLSVNTPAQKVGEEIEIALKDFQLHTLSQIIEKDSSFVSGKLNGSFRTKNEHGTSAFIADIKIDSLALHETPVGNIDIQADNNNSGVYQGKIKLTGNENDVVVTASYHAAEKPFLESEVKINSLNMNSLAAFTGGQISNATGKVSGLISVKGDISKPDLKGKINFYNVAFHSSYANNYFTLKNENLEFDQNGIYLKKFTMLDSTSHTAILDGSVYMKDFSISEFDMAVKLNQFTVLNTTINDNKLFFGKLILNSNTKITGTVSLPKIYSSTKMIEGSYFTVSVPESKISNNRGDGVVIFTDPHNKINPILKREDVEQASESSIKGLDLSADVEVDRKSTLKILVDPVSGDSLVLRGDATMSFGIDPSGKTSLTGTYTVAEGSYRVSLQELIRKDFTIKSGSTITWNGDPTDADIHIDAIHEQKTSPIDLVAGQIGGLSEQEKNTYRQSLPFQVILHMSGQLLKPVISFEIDLPARYRGAMGGTVYAKLSQLNNDQSELNKQVFALLVLGRFVQEDPLASAGGGGGVESVARTSVSKFLSQQLNKFSDKYIKGVELNFDLQSYDDYSSGNAEAKTDLAIGVKKELFDQKLSVQVGSTVNLSDDTHQSNSNELASDVTVEYKLTEDGIYRLKAFRQNQYEDIIEGPLNVTGLGLIYTRDFDRWQDLFKREKDFDKGYVPVQDK